MQLRTINQNLNGLHDLLGETKEIVDNYISEERRKEARLILARIRKDFEDLDMLLDPRIEDR